MPNVSCLQCQQAFTVDYGGRYQCPHCGHTQDVDGEGRAMAVDAAQPISSAIGSVPFEQRESLGFFSSLVDTAKAILTEPTAFFKGMPRETGVKDAFLYGLLVGSVSTYIGQLVFFPAMGGAIKSLFPNQDLGFLEAQATSPILNLFVAPLTVALQMIVAAGIGHLFLMIFGAANAKFTATLKVQSYAQTVSIFQIVPGFGNLVAMIWSFIVLIIGLSEVHQTSRTRVFWALTTPGLICCLCCGAAIMLGAATLLKNFGG